MAKNFLDEETEPRPQHLGYIEGFRFGFGMFLAFLLGFLVVCGGGLVVAKLLRLH